MDVIAALAAAFAAWCVALAHARISLVVVCRPAKRTVVVGKENVGYCPGLYRFWKVYIRGGQRLSTRYAISGLEQA